MVLYTVLEYVLHVRYLGESVEGPRPAVQQLDVGAVPVRPVLNQRRRHGVGVHGVAVAVDDALDGLRRGGAAQDGKGGARVERHRPAAPVRVVLRVGAPLRRPGWVLVLGRLRHGRPPPPVRPERGRRIRRRRRCVVAVRSIRSARGAALPVARPVALPAAGADGRRGREIVGRVGNHALGRGEGGGRGPDRGLLHLR